MTNRWLSWLLVLVAAASLAGCGGGSGGAKEAAGGSIELPTVYKQNCLSCHGSELQGKVGPNLQQVGARLTEDEIAALVSKGKGGMPAYATRLSQADIQSLAQWLAEKK